MVTCRSPKPFLRVRVLLPLPKKTDNFVCKIVGLFNYKLRGEKMLSNYHTHTNFCDGKNTAEEVVSAAIDKGFKAIGFSGHGYTPFDTSYCMTDTDGYIREISRLKNEYAGEIEIYCGVEEDIFSPVKRESYDYIIGSSHYFKIGGSYLPVDESFESLKKAIDEFGGDPIKLAESYYNEFVTYINTRKPDIVGHFDLLTKFDEMGESIFSRNSAYINLAEKYLKEALHSEVIFEVNTGAISRGYRKTPYPDEKLLYTIMKNSGKVIISSDSHSAETLDFYFNETKDLLRDIGFKYICEFKDGKFKQTNI